MSRSLSREEFFAAWSSSHGGASITGIVKIWLNISFAITRPLIVLRISPNLLSLLSIFMGIAFLASIESNWTILFLILSLLLDGIDGTVAICTGKTSRYGAVVDAVADRLVEATWAIGLTLLGAPWQVVAGSWLAAFLQEYMRARAGGLGIGEVLIVTWAERPIRATLIFIPLIGRLFGMDLFSIAAIFWLVLQLSSAVVLFNSLRLRLQQSPR